MMLDGSNQEVSGHISIDLLAHVICTCFFKGEKVIVFKWLLVVHMVVCEVPIVLQSKFIKLFRDAAIGPNYKSYNRPYVLISFPGILVVSNDLDTGTAFDCLCCFCQLSIHVGSHSIHRT